VRVGLAAAFERHVHDTLFGRRAQQDRLARAARGHRVALDVVAWLARRRPFGPDAFFGGGEAVGRDI
jgi:hypothetical protein